MPKLTALFVAAVAACLATTTNAAAQTTGCMADTSVRACVIAAAVTLTDAGDSETLVTVSVSLRLTNTTDYPIELAATSDDVALIPQNADALMSGQGWRTDFSGGLQRCSAASNCTFATVAPGQSAILQYRYLTRFSTPGLPLMQVARTASFSSALFVRERGVARRVSVALEGFSFGNGLTARR